MDEIELWKTFRLMFLEVWGMPIDQRLELVEDEIGAYKNLICMLLGHEAWTVKTSEKPNWSIITDQVWEILYKMDERYTVIRLLYI